MRSRGRESVAHSALGLFQKHSRGVALLTALAFALPFSDQWKAAEACTHVEAAEDKTRELAAGPVSFPDPGRDTTRRARRQERKPPRARKPSPAGAAPLRSVARRSLGARDAAELAAARAAFAKEAQRLQALPADASPQRLAALMPRLGRAVRDLEHAAAWAVETSQPPVGS